MEVILQSITNTNTCPMAVIVRDGKVLMGHRHYVSNRKKITISVWTCPGGRCDEGETIETTLRREVEEETGIKDLEIVDFLLEVPGITGEDTVPLFLCGTKQEAILVEPHKFSEWRWFGIDDFPESHINEHSRSVILKLLKNVKYQI